MQILSLNGTWDLQQEGREQIIPAVVPGCVHTALIDHHVLENPFYRDNEKDQMWVGEAAWLYQRRFEVDADFLKHDCVYLRCYGLDTIAKIEINGQHVSNTENMFRTYIFDVKAYLQVGSNKISIHFASPSRYVAQMDAEKGEMASWAEPMRTNGGAWIRKEPCNFGWDWGPKMITSGIWRDIELVGFNVARLTDVAILQSHQYREVSLTVNGYLEHADEQSVVAQIEVIGPDGLPLEYRQEISDVRDDFSATLQIKQPALWWPNGLGEQPLYTLRVTLVENDQVLDTLEKRIGLRTLTLERQPDQWGESFYFACNGVPFFAKGANWIPVTPYPGSATEADHRLFVEAAADANINMLRAWGGGIYEDDIFYDLCDELGLTVWQDFIFSCGTYPSFDDEFMVNVEAEARDNIRRIRHHACLALWCGNNEIEQGLPTSPGWLDSMSWDDYSRLFDELLANLAAELDPQTSYWPGSPHSPCGDRNNWENPDCGDTHLWMVWHGLEPFEWYRTRPDRFCSEFGFQSFPEPAVVDEFTIPADRNITSYIMEYHQRSRIGNSTIIHYMLDWFRMPSSFDSLVWLSQILQGMAMKYAVEHWRRNMPRTMGTLYWQLNDMWPAPSWSSLDWKGNWKALHYMAKRFYAPLLISGLEDTEASTVEINITSDLLTSVEGTVEWVVTDVMGKTILSDSFEVTTPVQGNSAVKMLDIADVVSTQTTRDVLVWLALNVDGEVVSQDLVLLSRPKHFDLGQPDIQLDVEQVEDKRYRVRLTTDVPALYVWLELAGARFSDNFFHLRPGVSHAVYVTTSQIDGIQVKSLVDTFEY